MMAKLRLRHGLLLLSLGLAALPAGAGDDCDAPLGHWQSREAVRQMAAAQGWQIQRLKIDDGCYEIRATDAQGQSFKAKLDPETLRVLKLKRDDPQRARERHRDAEPTAPQARPTPADSASAPAPAPAPAGASQPDAARRDPHR